MNQKLVAAAFLAVVWTAYGISAAETAMDKTAVACVIPNLVCFWDFQEEAGKARVSKGDNGYALREAAGAVERVEGGVFGPHAARLKQGQWFNLPRAECPALNVHGPKAQVSVVAWIKRAKKDHVQCEAIAGMWNETDKLRQYCLFLNLGLDKSRDQVCGHISAVGGPTAGNKYCIDAAIGATKVAYDAWHCVAFTYDGTEIKAYLEGKLEPRPGRKPYAYPNGIFDGGDKGADFTVGAVHRSGEMGNWFTGTLGGLAVYNRALTEPELAKLAACLPKEK